MKKIPILICLMILASCTNKNGIEITALKAPNNTKVYLLEVNTEVGSIAKIDSVSIENGKAFLPHSFEDIEMTYLQVGNDDEGKITTFFSDPGKILINFNYENPNQSIVSGTKNNDIFQEYRNQLGPIQTKMSDFMSKNSMELVTLSESQDAEDQKQFKALSNTYRTYLEENNKLEDAFIQEHKNDIVGLYVFYQKVLSQEESASDYQNEFGTFSIAMQDSRIGKKISDHFGKLETIDDNALEIGDLVPNFTIPTADGQTVNLYDFIANNKLTLIDFWASWCGPCRLENPNLVATYQEYQKKGFEILGVSLDSNKDRWLAAIQKDQLQWTQVSNLEGAQDPIAIAYALEGIPASFLVDQEGTILELDLRGSELKEAIEKHLKN